MERLTDLVDVLAERCDTQFNTLLRYQHMLVCSATTQVLLSLTSPLTRFDLAVKARMNPPQLSSEPPLRHNLKSTC